MYTLFLALRYIRRRGITYLAIGAVALGVFALVVVISVMRGFSTEMRSKIRGYTSDIVIESQYYFHVRNPEEIEGDLKKYLGDELEGSSPYVQSFILLETDTVKPGEIRGIDPEKELNVTDLANFILRDNESELFLRRFEAERKIVRRRTDVMSKEREVLEKRQQFGIGEEDYRKLVSWAREGAELLAAFFRRKDKKSGARYPDEKIRNYFVDWVKTRGMTESAAKRFYRSLRIYEQCKKELKQAEQETEEYREKIKKMKAGRKPLTKEEVLACFPECNDLGNMSEPRSLVIGVHWLRDLGISPGLDKEYPEDKLKGMTPDLDDIGTGPRERLFRITGIFFTGVFENDRSKCYGRLEDVKEFVNARTGVSGVAVNIKSHDRVTELRDVVRSMPSVSEFADYRVLTWEDSYKTLLSAVEMEKRLIKFIIFFMIILAGFLVFALLKIMADTRTRDLGVVKAVGGTPGGVLGIFLASAVMIGLVGSALGLLLSLRFGYYINEIADFIYTLTGWHPFPPNVYYLDKIPWFTDWSEVVSVVLPTLVISFMVGLFPAWFGARSHPMESLRYE
ncbi:MAG: FtsX-like permease family protein [Planctomycetota bacterium]